MTGRFSISNSTDLRAGMRQVLADGELYYRIGYYPARVVQDGKFRRINVEVRGRPDLVVRTRAGYFAPSGSEVESKSRLISRALASPSPLTDIRVHLFQTYPIDDRVAQATARIDARTLSFRQEGSDQIGSVEIIGLAYGLDNKLAAGFSRIINLRLRPEAYSRAMAEGVSVRDEVKLERPGIYCIRLIVIDRETGRLGSATDWVEVD
jgi:hypothetical protein